MERNRGASLLELVMAVAILAIVLGLAQPSFASIVESSRLANTSHQVTASLASARIQAITHGQRVTVCPVSASRRCTGSNDWSQGWMVFADPGRIGQPADADAILELVERHDSAGSLRVGTTPGRRLVRFAPNGMAAGTNLTLSICAATGDRLLGQVVIAVSGRARSSRPTPGAPCPFGPPTP